MNPFTEVGIYILLSFLFFFVPFQKYASRLEHELNWNAIGNVRLFTILVSYLIWYPPIAVLFFSAYMNEQFGSGFNWLLFGTACIWSSASFFYLEQRMSK